MMNRTNIASILYTVVTVFFATCVANETHGATTFTAGGSDNINVAANWNNGLPTTGNLGTVNEDATWWPDDSAAGGGGGTGAGANKLVGYDLDVIGTQATPITFNRGANFIPEFENVNLLLKHASMVIGNNRVLRISGTSVLTVGIGASVTLPNNRNFEFQNDGAGEGRLIVNGGSASADGINVNNDNAVYAFLTFGAGNGLVTLNDLISFAVTNPYIDFLSGSRGVLDIGAANTAYYESLWDSGNLRIDGANSGTFANNFGVDGSQLSLRYLPEPSTLVLAAFGLVGLAFGRRRRRA